jgi:hypothetical protein
VIAFSRVSSGEILFVVLVALWLAFDFVRERRRRAERDGDSSPL